jgi:hypothetical protein
MLSIRTTRHRRALSPSSSSRLIGGPLPHHSDGQVVGAALVVDFRRNALVVSEMPGDVFLNAGVVSNENPILGYVRLKTPLYTCKGLAGNLDRIYATAPMQSFQQPAMTSLVDLLAAQSPRQKV